MIDLHMHSTFSDGTFTPEELVEEALKQKLTAIALTDHDSTAGWERLSAAASGTGLRTITGVEVSAEFEKGGMDILGYFIDPEDASLNKQLQWIRDGRNERNAEILQLINKLGMEMTMDEVEAHAGADVVGRPHFAQAMIQRGYVSNKQQAFDKYLADGKPACVQRPSLSPQKTIEALRAGGGVPVLAHPYLLKRKISDMRSFVGELASYGLQGIEVYYPEHHEKLREEFLALAKEFDLAPSGGSDFHGAISPHLTLGRGKGKLKVPDDVLEGLEARRP